MQTKGDLFIEGQWIKGEGAALESINPANNEVIWRGQVASHKQLEQAVGCLFHECR